MRIKIIKNYLIFLWLITLTFIAGMINIYSLKNFNVSISHQTGNISIFSINIYERNKSNYLIFLVIFLFFLGAAISGFLFHERNLKLQKRYGAALFICGIILNLMYLIKNNDLAIVCMLTLIIGFQNGMFIKSNNILIRTSHFTGYLTDAGFLLGRVLRGYHKDIRTVFEYIVLIIFFILGGVFSSYLVDKNKKTIIFIGVFYMFSGLYYLILRKFFKDIE